jgi:3-hydroxyisobutyrate dehydrogenase
MIAIGFIGLGNMGLPMAGHLAAAGHPLVVSDLDAQRVAKFCARHGARSAPSYRELAEGCDAVVTILPTSKVVEAVLTGPDGVLAGLKPGAAILEMSSGAPAVTVRLAELTAAAGGVLIDAPVSGGVARAVTADLAIMVGGDAATIDRMEPVLKAMGSSILRTGPIGSAHAMKALNNLVSAAGLLATAEAMVIGKKFGLEAETMVDILNVSSGMNNSTQRKMKPFVLSRKFNSGFGMGLMVKDLTIALDMARDLDAPSPLSAATRELWAAALAMGLGEDHTDIARLPERLGKVELS